MVSPPYLTLEERLTSMNNCEFSSDRLNDVKSLDGLSSDEGACSLNSSYADVFEASGVIIRDYEGSSIASAGPFLITNAVTYNLNKCKSLVVFPYYKLLCLIAWRPFGKSRQPHGHAARCCYNVINGLYTLLIFGVLLFWYGIRVYTCEGRLALPSASSTPKPPSSAPPPTVPPNVSTWNWTDLTPSEKALRRNNGSHPSDYFVDPCQHVFGTYIVPNLLHFLAFAIGFYHFRMQEHEGLYALMEKVYLQSNCPGRMTKHLRIYLIVGMIWLLVSMGTIIFDYFAFGFDVSPGLSKVGPVTIYLIEALIVISGVYANCVYLAVVLSYCGQCQLLAFYIGGVAERLEEKTTELNTAMKEILDIKRHFNRLNGMLSLSMSCILFDLIIVEGISVILLFNFRQMSTISWLYRMSMVIQWGAMLIFLVVQAAYLTSRERVLKDKVLAIRVYGYQSHSEAHIDSFLNFINMIKLQAQIFTIPVKPRYLWGVFIVSIQILIFAFQTGRVMGESKWL